MTSRQALALVKKHGIVLEAARGPVPSLAEAIVGEPIRGSWWGHPRSHEIYAVLGAVRDSEEILVCRLVKGKVTFVHRRLWPALARCADRFPPEALAEIHEQHTSTGRHATTTVPFPRWVPADVIKSSRMLAEDQALAQLGSWAQDSAAG